MIESDFELLSQVDMEPIEQAEVWDGLLTVAPREECTLLDANQGACVHVLTLAVSETEYRAKVIAAMNHYFLDILQIENVIPFSQLDASEELAIIARELQTSKNPKHVRFVTLHTFPRVM